MLELDCGAEYDAGNNAGGANDADFFSALPPRAGVLLFEMKDARAQPYLARTADIRRAAERLLRPPEEFSKRLNLREVAARIRYRVTGSKFEQTLTLYHQSRALFPHRYRDVMRLRPPALLKVNLRNSYPRCYVTRGIRADEAFYFGPFLSRRVADAFAEGLLDLFKTRRCQIRILRDPSFPGCIYSEMKMCLAPCFAGCTKDAYDAEVAALLETLETTGSALIERYESERLDASESLDFERAAAIHKRIEKASAALRGLPEIARRIGRLDAVLLQRSAEEKTVVVFPVRSGIIGEPLFLRFGEIYSQPRSVEAIMRQALDANESSSASAAGSSPRDDAPDVSHTPDSRPASTIESAPPASLRERYGLRAAPPELSDHLSILARWFYAKPREGELFFREADWPYRRILRACGRLLAPPETAAEDPPSP